MNRRQWIETNLKVTGAVKAKGFTHCLCPFHGDNSPSAGIDFSSGVFNCLACGEKMFLDQLATRIGVDPPSEEKQEKQMKEVARYDYKNIDGKTIYQQVRFQKVDGSKTFRSWNPANQTWSLKSLTRYPYQLPEIIAAQKKNQPIFIAEGEKDVETLRKLGYAATTNNGGCGSTVLWKGFAKKYFLPFTRIYICPDADPEGARHAGEIATALRDQKCSVTILDFGYEVKEKKEGGGQDVTDWITAGHTAEEFKSLLTDCRDDELIQIETDISNHILIEKVLSMELKNLTEVGNADFFIALYGEIVRYCAPGKKWIIWNGKFWEDDRACKINIMAKTCVRFLRIKASYITDDDFSVKVLKWAIASEKKQYIESIVFLSRGEVPILPENFDKDFYKINVNNGIVDLKTGKLLSHDQKENMTRIMPVDYNIESNCPTWIDFLTTIMCDRKELVDYLQRVIGYSLTGIVTERCFFVLHGKGRNGKSTFIEVIKHIMSEYAKSADADSFIKSKMERQIRNDIARLQSARLVSVSETGRGKSLDENMIKQMSGDDNLTVRFLHQEHFEFKPQFKIFLITNHLPKVTAEDEALWDRVRKIPFDYRVPDDKVDKNLKEKLNAEAEGILAWAVRGCLLWQRDGLTEPETVKHATADYRLEQDVVGQFVIAACVLRPGDINMYIKGAVLLEKYHEWSGNKGMFGRTFYELLESKGVMKKHKKDGTYLYGVGLLDAAAAGGAEEDAMKKAGLV